MRQVGQLLRIIAWCTVNKTLNFEKNGVTGRRCLYDGKKKRLFTGQGDGNRKSRNTRPWRRMGGLEMFFHVLLDGGERSSSLTGLVSTSDIIIQIRGWVDRTGRFDARKGGFARSGGRNNYSAVVQPVSWSLYRTNCICNSSTDESNVWEESSDRDKTDTVMCSYRRVCNRREFTLCVDRGTSWIWEKTPVSIQAVYGYVSCAYFCAATDRGRSYCLRVTDGVNCLTASLAYNRGWDKDTTEKLGREFFPLKYQQGFVTGVI